VGVFQDQPTAQVLELAIDSGVDVIQFHGEESDEAVRRVVAEGFPVIRVCHLPPAGDGAEGGAAAAVVAAADVPGVVAVLLDTSVPGAQGGTGVAFDWATAASLGGDFGLPVLVAGGLKPGNVKAAIAECGPLLTGVDASSALETDEPGKKDLEKVTAFVAAAISGRP